LIQHTFLSALFLFILGSPVLTSAAEIPFEVRVDRKTVELGSAVKLELIFTGSQGVPAPELPASDGWQANYQGRSSMMSLVNGRMSQSVTHTYLLVPLKTGKFAIGPFRFNYKSDTYVSDSMTLEVITAQSLPPVNSLASGTAGNTQNAALNDRVFLTLEAERSKAYINEKIPVTVKLYISQIAIRDPEYPVIEHEGISVGEYGQPKQYSQVKNGIRYEVLEFSTMIFGTRPGSFNLGPATLNCVALVQKSSRTTSGSSIDDFFDDGFFNSMFGRFERHPLTVTSQELPFEILPLPEEGKPADFNGTLGVFNFDVSVGPGLVKVGDPITIKSKISGKGNFDTVTAPKLESTEGFKVYKSQVQVTPAGKVFEQIILPTSATIKEVPRLSFTYFDVDAGTYRTLRKGPFAVTVDPAPEGNLQIVEMTKSNEKAVVHEVFGRDLVYVKLDPGTLRARGNFLYCYSWYRWLHLFPLFLFALVALMTRRKDKLASDVRYRRRHYASRKAKKGIERARAELKKNPEEFYDAVFKTVQEYLGDLFHLPSAGITADIIDHELRGRDIPEEELARLRMIFTECDMVRYAPSEFDKDKMAHTFQELTRSIDFFERNKRK
jgi:hypothetical protein